MSRFRQLVANLSVRTNRFNSRPAHVGILLDKVTMGQLLLRILRLSLINFIPPTLHIQSFIPMSPKISN